MASTTVLGFVGLGVMGEPMCKNLAAKSGARVVAFDPRSAPLDALAPLGVERAASAADARGAGGDRFRLSARRARGARRLPRCRRRDGAPRRGPHPRGHEHGAGGARPRARRGRARAWRGFADAPVARTAQAARRGPSRSWWARSPALFERLRPYLACMGTEITHCGAVGAGAAVKLMNNMVVAQTVVALAEALAVARASGAVDPEVLFRTLAKGSADSFVLRNHGMKSLLPDDHPTRGAFPTSYIIKDLSYAIALAEEAGLDLAQAATTKRLMEQTAAAGYRDSYYTAVIRTMLKR